MKNLLIVSLSLLFSIQLASQNDAKSLRIVFIGNSITEGSWLENPKEEAAPIRMCEYLEKQDKIKSVKYANRGRSGATTVDFLPASETLFPKLVEETDKLIEEKTTLIFSMMLGTNDSAEKGPNGSPVSPVQYYTNMKVIIDELHALYPSAIFVIHNPIWYSPNTYNSSIYLKAGLNRLNSYHPMIDKLVADYAAKKPNLVFKGDTEAYAYFEANSEAEFTHENGNAGTFFLHPNKSGAIKLGEFWGKAIYNILFPQN
ncbi:GDSL-type esterase/lipase family protein [Dysgonomonas sp. Marseille-P4361]|uniref:GDSL-type esterase/lipase family protein n=1 Tax=Dysgonomonas sp. Marseille-P4361 TaxID=2161820 RepID=UPI000D5607D9|nr:GDSL-type esterase/lipase family protein [Dysgonomonas sp. Marseille-P4361]